MKAPRVHAERDRVVIMIGGIGVSMSIENSQSIRRDLVAAEREAGAFIARSRK